MLVWVVSVPYIPSLDLYANYECSSREEAEELARQLSKSTITEVDKGVNNDDK